MVRPKATDPAVFVGLRIRKSKLDEWEEHAIAEGRTLRQSLRTHLESFASAPVVYRLFDKQGELLYVGVTERIDGRLGQHQSEKPWFSQVGRVTIDVFETRAEANRAEREAIQTERPLHNAPNGSGRQPHKNPRVDIPRFRLRRSALTWWEARAAERKTSAAAEMQRALEARAELDKTHPKGSK